MERNEEFITGTVTAVNTDLACFEIEDNIKVYMSAVLAEGTMENLPSIGSLVSFNKAHKFDSTYVICKYSNMVGNFEIDCPLNPFLNLVNRYRLGSSDIMKFDEIIKLFEKNFTRIDPLLKDDILLSLLQNLIMLTIEKGCLSLGRESCMNCIISKAILITTKNCKHVELKSNKYKDFPYWNFGVHPSNKNTLLFGYLEVQPVYGFYIIKDSFYQIACIVITDNCKKTDIEISQLQNCFVLIEKYTVITEIFNESGATNVEYIIAKVDDIYAIHSTQTNNTNFGIKPDDLVYTNVISFVVLKKSTVCTVTGSLPELLLQIFIRFNTVGLFWKEVFLVLPSKYVSLNLQLKEGRLYLMYYNSAFDFLPGYLAVVLGVILLRMFTAGIFSGDSSWDLWCRPVKEVSNPGLTRIKDLKIYEVPDQGCFFQPVNVRMLDTTEPLSVQECKFHVENFSDLVSFRGIIRSKRFTDMISHRTVKNSTIFGFGTPGKKVHQLVFSHIDDDRIIYLDCYLNNWENMLMPLGLMPQMEVIVRHVAPQSKRYVKSTIFTSFEVVSYRPRMSFSTVNLYKFDKENWGMPTYLSQGHKIPGCVLIWGQVIGVSMLKLKIISRCINCNRIVNNPVHCDACKETERKMEFSANFNVTDQYGQSSVTTESLEVLRTFLNLKPVTFEEWVTTFRRVGTYTYNFYDGGTENCEDFTRFLERIYDRRVVLELKCRKVELLPSPRPAKPLWTCLDARRH